MQAVVNQSQISRFVGKEDVRKVIKEEGLNNSDEVS
jgi:hypothetical protein